MKMKLLISSFCVILLAAFLISFQKDAKEPWSQGQLLAPAALAAKLNNNSAGNTVIFNIGPSGKIKKSIDIGATQEKGNLTALRKKLTELPKDTEVVIYCGCCPFADCPNIRPAFNLAKEMHFTNAKLLNLPKNLKVDWIDKGYPMQR